MILQILPGVFSRKFNEFFDVKNLKSLNTFKLKISKPFWCIHRYLPQNSSETCMKDVHLQYSINLIIDLSSIAIHKSSCLRHGVAFKQKRCLSCLRHLLFKIHEKKIPNILRRSCSPIYREKNEFILFIFYNLLWLLLWLSDLYIL